MRVLHRIYVVCPCGQPFTTTRRRRDAGRGRRCSKACQYRYATRPSGLSYKITAQNPGWVKPGQHLSPETERRTGGEPWNRGRRTGFAPANVFRPSAMLTYGALHGEVRRARGPAWRQKCVREDRTCKGPMHWANVSGLYEGIWDFQPMCQSHHFRHDQAMGRWGGSTDWSRPR